MRRALKRHDPRCSRYAARERVWLAARESEEQVPERQRIRFAYQRVSVLMSYLTTEKPVGRVAPLRPGQECEDAARSLQKATNEWRRRDRRDEKEVELALTACIYGTAPAKSLWEYERVTESRREAKKAFMGVGPTKFVEVERDVTLHDEPSLLPWNVYDHAWDPSASGPDDIRYAVSFSYPTKPELLAMQKNGIYSNIDDLSPSSPQAAKEFQRPGRDRDLEGRIEVCEVWDKEENRLVAIANRSVLIRDQDSPYKHRSLPWVYCSTQPNMWTLDGTSEVELVAAIQAEMHSFRAEWVMNAKLANKLLLILDSSTTDTEKAVNSLMIEDGAPVKVVPIDPYSNPPFTWSPAASLVPLGAEINQALKVDMDDMSGVGPYVSGQSEKSVDPKTATEVSTLQSASMRRINAMKNMLGHGYHDASVLDLKNMKQFFHVPLAIRMDGIVNGAAIVADDSKGYSWDFVDPQDVVDADFEYLMTDADENIDKQEKRTQWLTLFQTAGAMLPAFMPGEARPNMAKLFENVLESYDVEDAADLMVQPPPPLPIAPVDPGTGVPLDGGSGFAGASPLGAAPPPSGGPVQAATNPGGAY